MMNFEKQILNRQCPTLNCNKGQGMVEYGLILGLIALICTVMLSSLGNTIYDFFFSGIKSTMETITKTVN